MPLCLLQSLQHDTASMFKPLDSSQTARHWGRAKQSPAGWSEQTPEGAGLVQPRWWTSPGAPRAAWPSLWGGYPRDRARLVSATWWEGEKQGALPWTRRHSSWVEGKANAEREANEAGQVPSLEALNAWQDKTLSILGWHCSWPCFEQEVGLETSWGPFQAAWS